MVADGAITSGFEWISKELEMLEKNLQRHSNNYFGKFYGILNFFK